MTDDKITHPGEEPDCDFWTDDDGPEDLLDSDIHEAIESAVSYADPTDPMPERLTMYGYSGLIRYNKAGDVVHELHRVAEITVDPKEWIEP